MCHCRTRARIIVALLCSVNKWHMDKWLCACTMRALDTGRRLFSAVWVSFFCAAARELHPRQHEAGHCPNTTDRRPQPHSHDDRNWNQPAEPNCRTNKETDQRGGTGEAFQLFKHTEGEKKMLKSTCVLCSREISRSCPNKFAPVYIYAQ